MAGSCARESFARARTPMPDEVRYTSIYSRRDGIVDWRACLDPQAVGIEVTASHTGMGLDPRVRDHVVAALRVASEPVSEDSALEVDGRVGA